MRKLFTIDEGGWQKDWPVFERPSVRGIIIREKKAAMVYSKKYSYWKFPGGGIEEGESLIDTLIREVREESGLIVIPETIREFGHVPRYMASTKYPGHTFFQENWYFLTDTEKAVSAQELCDYEAEEGFSLYFIEPETAIKDNREKDHGPKDRGMLEREARVLEILIDEGYFR